MSDMVPEVIQRFSFSTQLSMKFKLLINTEMKMKASQEAEYTKCKQTSNESYENIVLREQKETLICCFTSMLKS